MSKQSKILTVVGARPQFIKAAPVSLALKEAGFAEVLVNTGQHYDANMCDIFFEQLNLNPPHYHLGIGSGSHGYQTGEGMNKLEPILEAEKPDAVLVYGDTNATLAGALTAAKSHYPLAHVEAGLRSFNRRMPEEINRVVTDHLSQWLFVPTQTGIDNLAREGITEGVHLTGDVMMDAVNLYRPIARKYYPDLLDDLGIKPNAYYLLTMHRAETTVSPERAAKLLSALDSTGAPVVFPVHPRIRPLVASLEPFVNIRCLEPVSYFEMLLLTESAKVVLTDSGGLQKEATFLETPCITLREETEWPETIQAGWNCLVDLSVEQTQDALKANDRPRISIHDLYGGGRARNRISQILASSLIYN